MSFYDKKISSLMHAAQKRQQSISYSRNKIREYEEKIQKYSHTMRIEGENHSYFDGNFYVKYKDLKNIAETGITNLQSIISDKQEEYNSIMNKVKYWEEQRDKPKKHYIKNNNNRNNNNNNNNYTNKRGQVVEEVRKEYWENGKKVVEIRKIYR